MIKLKKIYITLLIGGCFSFGNIALNLAESFAQDNPETPQENVLEEPEETPSLTAIDWYKPGTIKERSQPLVSPLNSTQLMQTLIIIGVILT